MSTPAHHFSAVMDITPRPETVFVSGRGCWLLDQNGKRYLDFVQGWAVNCLGHCAPAVTGALVLQASRLINCSPAFFNAPMVQLANILARHSGLDRVFFANSGAEANEGAIKLARKWGALHRAGASTIVTMAHSFHGRTLATMSASGKPQWERLFEPKVAGFRKVPFNDIGALTAALTPDTVAVMMEPIQGEAGVYPATDEFLRDVRKLTEERGVLLILDEIQTGIGRTGMMFGYQHAGVRPDIMTLGKGLGGGVPLAALVARADVCCFAPGDQGGTFNGNPLMTAVGCAVVDEIGKPGFLDEVKSKGLRLSQRLEALSARHGLGGIRGRGLLLGLGLESRDGADIVARAHRAGLLLNAPRRDTLRFMPPLNVTDGEIDEMIQILDRVLSELYGAP
jgi:acetylornithine/N-succinyldiaminopimelate aminotransferase